MEKDRRGEKIVGVLGGMGPEATLYFLSKLIELTPASRDQEHLRVIIYSNPKIPDRTEAIMGRGESPLPELVKTAKILEEAGADFIVIPCVTAHYFFEELKKCVSLPLLHIVQETLKELLIKFPLVKRVGLIATSGTIEGKLFPAVFEQGGIETLVPSSAIQTHYVMEAIYALKAGRPREGARALFIKAAEDLQEKGAQAIIAGCTEVPLALKGADLSIPLLEPLEILAQASIAFAKEVTGRKGGD